VRWFAAVLIFVAVVKAFLFKVYTLFGDSLRCDF
jgi:hypothetical protein